MNVNNLSKKIISCAYGLWISYLNRVRMLIDNNNFLKFEKIAVDIFSNYRFSEVNKVSWIIFGQNA